MRIANLLIIAVAVAGSATAANAAPRGEAAVTEAVNYADLDLRSARDQARLKDRINWVAYRLCLTDMTATPSPSTADPACFHAAVNSALEQMNRAMARVNGGPAIASAEAPAHH